jgi:prophage maintenance system killer protein
MLNLNGYDLAAEQCQVVDLALDVVGGTLTLQKAAEFFEAHAEPILYPDISEE